MLLSPGASKELKLPGHLESQSCLRVEGCSHWGGERISPAATLLKTGSLGSVLRHAALIRRMSLAALPHWLRLTGGKARCEGWHLSVGPIGVGPTGDRRTLRRPRS